MNKTDKEYKKNSIKIKDILKSFEMYGIEIEEEDLEKEIDFSVLFNKDSNEKKEEI